MGEAALKILSVLFLYGSEKFAEQSADIKALLEKCMEFGNDKTKGLAIKCLCSLVATLPAKIVKTYFSFSTPVLVLCNDMAFKSNDIDETSEILISFSEIVETEPKFFRNSFNDLTDLMIKLRNLEDLEIGIKEQCVEIIISMSQRYPELLKKDQSLMKKIVEMVFRHMMEISDSVTEQWMNPPDGFDEDLNEDDDQSIVKFSVDCLDRLISHVGAKSMLSFLSDCVKNLLAEDNWKMKHSAFMALSQIGEYIDDPEEIAPIIQTIGEYIAHDNPRVRYACCHCIGQLSDDMAPDFQMLYLDKVMPMIAQRLEDKVPRVKGHACASLTNLLESCKLPETQIKPYISDLYNKLWELIKNESTFVKENSLSALSALSVGATEQYFGEFYDNNMEQLLDIVERATQKEYKKLIGHAIECATISSKMVGKEKFLKWCERLVRDMIALQEHIIQNPDTDGDDPQLGFLLSGWQRLSVLMEEDFLPYINQMMPTLIQLCKEIIKTGKKYENDDEAEEEGDDEKITQFNSYEDDNCFVAINMIKLFLKKCKTALSAWVKQIYEVIVPLMNYLPNDSVRTTASRCLPYIILAMRGTDTEANIPEFAKLAITEIWKAMELEPEVENLLLHCKAMQKVITHTGKFLDNNGLETMYKKCLDHLKNSHQRKDLSDQNKDEDEDEEEVQNVLKMEKEMEDEFCCQIAEILGKLFETHKEQTLPIVKDLDAKFIANSLQDSSPDRLKKFGLFLICDIIDHLGELDEVKKTYFEVRQRFQEKEKNFKKFNFFIF